MVLRANTTVSHIVKGRVYSSIYWCLNYCFTVEMEIKASIHLFRLSPDLYPLSQKSSKCHSYHDSLQYICCFFSCTYKKVFKGCQLPWSSNFWFSEQNASGGSNNGLFSTSNVWEAFLCSSLYYSLSLWFTPLQSRVHTFVMSFTSLVIQEQKLRWMWWQFRSCPLS